MTMLSGPDLATLSTAAVYAVVWGFVFVECGLLVGFLLPGDSLLFGAGLLAGSPHSSINLPLLVGGTFIAAIAGNDVAYRTGRRYGRSWIHSREEGRAKEGLRRAEAFYERRGWWSVVIARWLSWVRTFVPVIAGTAAMDRRAFTSANLVGRCRGQWDCRIWAHLPTRFHGFEQLLQSSRWDRSSLP